MTVRTTPGLPDHDLPAGDCDFYSSRPWLRYQMLDESTESLVVSVWSSPSHLVAAAPVYLSRAESNPLYRLEVPGIDGPVDIRSPRALVGNRRGYRGGLLLDHSREDRHEAVELLLTSIVAECRERGVSSVWWPYLRTSELRTLLPHAEQQVPRLLAGDCSIHLTGSTFDDYLSSLPGSRRREISRERRVMHSTSGLDIRTDPLPGLGPQLAELVHEHGRRHGSSASAHEVATLIARQELACGTSGWVTSARDRQGMHSACLSYTTADQITVRAFGSRENDRRRSAYFELAYYQQIEQAYAMSAGKVHLGIGTLRAKVLRGARVEPLWGLRLGTGTPASATRALTRLNREEWDRMVLEAGTDSLSDAQPDIEEWI